MPWVKIEIGATRRKRGKRLKVHGTNLVIGRGEACTIWVKNDHVSRRHAALVLTERGWLVQDLGSANGTLLNDRRIAKAELRARDVLRLGEAGPKVHVIQLDPPGFAPRAGVDDRAPAQDGSSAATGDVHVEPEAAARFSGEVGAPWLLLFGLLAGVSTGLEVWPAAFPYREAAAPAVWLAHLVGGAAPTLLATKAAWLVTIASGLYFGMWGLGCQRITKRWPILVMLALVHASAYFALTKLGA